MDEMGKKEKKRKSSSSTSEKKAKKKESKKKKRSSSSEAKSSSEEKVVSTVSQMEVPLRVSGCQNKVISEVVKGTYFRHGSNHGKPVYKKRETQKDEDLDVTDSAY